MGNKEGGDSLASQLRQGLGSKECRATHPVSPSCTQHLWSFCCVQGLDTGDIEQNSLRAHMELQT